MTTVSKRLPRTSRSSKPVGKSTVTNAISSRPAPYRSKSVGSLAERLENGTLDLKRLESLPDEEALSELDKVRGIGRWTAEMFLIFKLGRTDVLPVDDLGLRKAAQKAYRLRKLPTRDRFEQLAEKWHPYSSISTFYLWKSMERPEAPAKW